MNSATTKPTKRLSCVMLAAGLSTRMGQQNKLLIDIQGQSLVRKTARLFCDYARTKALDEIVVVLGHEAEYVAKELIDLPLRTVINEDYKLGQMSSVHKGLEALEKETDGIIIALSDLVLLEQADMANLHEAFNQCNSPIIVPQYQGQRANPIILQPSQREAILQGQKNLGCRKLIEKNPESVTTFEVDNDHFSFDLDTPAAVQELHRRLSLDTQRFASSKQGPSAQDKEAESINYGE